MASNVGTDLQPGTRVRFSTRYGLNAGEHVGTVRRYMVPAAFHPCAGDRDRGHYEVEVFVAAHGYTDVVCVKAEQITAILDE